MNLIVKERIRKCERLKKEIQTMSSTANSDTYSRQQASKVAQMSASGLVYGFKPVADENQSGSIPPSGPGVMVM
ncbi:hypothetical protein CEXT_604411 [Caerostris extrusa]|uniref:Uncharacterized protein n=1 Tax=Caerostris extrusa TaxID=172846 RepID=A0AAV4RC48_CAEEX|nr:hypothetical protein CEXT_604411 [Caerostris extrusa]